MNMGVKKNQKNPRGCHVWWKCRLFVAVVAIACVDSQDISTCCYRASEPCRSVCEKMSFVDNMTSGIIMKEEKILNVYKFCSPKLIEFWICMNQTIQDVITGSGWWGRACCTHVRSPACREACASAANSTALAAVCRKSDELAFFDCVEIQEEAQNCCSNTQSIHCHEACQAVLWRVGLSHVEYSARESAEEACEQSPTLLHCFRDLSASTVHTDTQKYLPCCSMSADEGCRNTCEEILQSTGELHEIYDALEKACGLPAIDNKLWQCFLRKVPPPETRDPVPHDIAKLHCCSKASTSDCKKLCFSTYNVGWLLNWQKFYTDCLGDPKEVELSQCIEEVDSPCSLGCSGLTYCSQLNNRPKSLFRSCTSQADLDAHMAVVEQTGSGYVTVSGFQLPLKNSSECTPDVWKSVACALHVKPCTKQGHSSLLCMEECMRVVSSCVQWSRAPPHASAAALCARLSHPDRTAPCVPLTHFMTPSAEPTLSAQEAVTSPCAGACGATQTCRVNRSCSPGAACALYSCHDGCPLGDKSLVVVEKGRWARMPSVSSVSSPPSAGSTASGSSDLGAYRVCACGARGLLQRCQPLPPLAAHHCAMHDHVVAHGEKFYMECNPCTCWAGERVCGRRACGAGRVRGALLTRLPCNCPPHHLPVTAHGRTYPNVCLAKCADVKDSEIEFGLRDACSGVVCSRHSPCLASPRVCLSQLQSHCPQHVCVNTSNCDSQPSSPVCDTDGKTHSNPCHLIMTGSRFAYWGECLIRCSTSGTVCGINGVSYSSECAAWSEYVSLDYFGPCVAVGPISDEMEPKCLIDRVVCPPLKHRNCVGFTAPGACCPRCGGALRILYSKKQIERAWYGTNISASVLHFKNLLNALDTHVKVAECALRGYLTIEMEIFVSVETVLSKPTDLQLHTCVLEAEKIADLINRESALMSSDIYLSALSYALIVHTGSSGASTSVSISPFVTAITIVVSLLCHYVMR